MNKTQPPKLLRDLNTWLVWRLVKNSDEKKPRKVPFYVSGTPRQGVQGGPEDRARLSDYATAVAALATGNYTGLGLAIFADCNVVALDFDHCVKDGVIDPRIESLVAGTYTEFSPSGTGLRAFMGGTLASKKDNVLPKDRNEDGSRKDGSFDVEFFGNSGFVTITGHITDDCELMGCEGTVLPLTDDVLSLYKARFGDSGALVVVSHQPSGLYDEADLSALTSTMGWSLDEARGHLMACDARADREDWLKAMMAIHHETSGSLDGLELCDEWSKTAGDRYGGRSSVESVWRSFGRSSGSAPVTGKWLLKWKSEFQANLKYEATDEWKLKLSAAVDEYTVREKICPEITKDMRLDDLGREALAQALVAAFRRLGTKLPIAVCRTLVAETNTGRFHGKTETPSWLDGWVYVTDDDKFYRMDSDEWLTKQGFDARFNREMPVDDAGEITTVASWHALNHVHVPVVTRSIYLPWADGVFNMEGVDLVNSYRPSSVPVAVEQLSPVGVIARDLFIKHIGLLCDGRVPEMTTLIDWLAHNVQHPGVKIRWAPLIKGIEGDGKTSLGALLRSVMGSANVRNVSPKVLGTDFTGWSQGSSVVTLEELRLTGHSRHDIQNALKPYITNDYIEVHAKGKDPYDAINTTNYMAFTNFADALPLTDTDRRWWILFTPYASSEQLAMRIGSGDWREVLGRHFTALNEAIEGQRSELRRWLLDHQISASFKPNGSAPMSEEKALMIGMSTSEDEHTIRETIEAGGVGVTKQVFLSSRLRELVVANGGIEEHPTTAWNRLLGRCGYTRLPKKFKWKGRSDPIWVLDRSKSEPEFLREILDATHNGVSDDDINGLF